MMEIRSSERNGVKLRWRVVSGREIVKGVWNGPICHLGPTCQPATRLFSWL